MVLAAAVRPVASVTVRVTLKVPGFAYVCVGFCSVLLRPSPKFQLKLYGPAPPDAGPVNEIARGATPSVGLAMALASSGPGPVAARMTLRIR